MNEPVEHALAQVLRTNRGTTPTRAGSYLCYVQESDAYLVLPRVLGWFLNQWYVGTAQPVDLHVVTWCGPLPHIAMESAHDQPPK